MSLKVQINLPTEADTDLLGQKLAQAISFCLHSIESKGFNVRLEGNLGAGKTSLIRAILRALGFNGRVKSPTFTLLETYSIKNVKFNHFDFYRFEDPEEFDDAGFRESFGPGQITATEWTDKAVPFVPKEDLKIIFYFQDAGRNVDLISSSNLGDQILTKMSELR